jgi:hypothetical protein
MIHTYSFVIAAVLFGFWHYNPSSNEMVYSIGNAKTPYHTCGFVSYSAPEQAGPGVDEGYMADVLASGGAKESYSEWFNTMDGAKAFVEAECGGVR